MTSLSAYRKYLSWLLWPGLALTTAGLVAGFVGGWSPLPVVLLAIGAGCVILGLIGGAGTYRRFWQRRSTQTGTNALVAVISVVLILAIVNFVAVRYGPRLDLTEAGRFTLAPETQQVVENLPEPVNVVVFDAALSPGDEQLLESYQRLSDELTYEHINPFQEPGIAREFNVGGEGREVHLEVGDQRIFVQPLGATGLTEQDLTNKLAQLGRDRSAAVYFLQGHDEFVIDGSAAGYGQAAEALRTAGYTVEELNLAETPTVPADADAVVVAGPKQALFEPEVEALETYLSAGGGLLLLMDPQTQPELEPLLQDWGISLDERLIIDASDSGQIVGLGPAAPLVTDYGEHPITAAFDGGRSFYPLARPVEIAERELVEATPLLLSNAQSYGETVSESGQLNVDTQKPPEGPFNIGVALTKPAVVSDEAQAEAAADEAETAAEVTEGEDDEETPAEPETAEAEAAAEELTETDLPGEARLVVIGNATFATDGLFDQQLNGDVFLNSVAWLSRFDDAVLSIRPKDITDRRIIMTVGQQIVVILLALVVLPLLGLGGAIVTWLRRR